MTTYYAREGLVGSTNYTDISAFLGQANPGGTTPWDTTTKPTLAQVQGWILDAEREVNRRCNRAWKKMTDTAKIYPYWSEINGGILKLGSHYPIIGVTSIYLWDGSAWETVSLTEGYSSDFYVHLEDGLIEFRGRFPVDCRNAVKMTHTWGQDDTATGYAARFDTGDLADIKEAVQLLVAIKMATSSDYLVLLSKGGETYSVDNRIREWKERYERIIADNTWPVRL